MLKQLLVIASVVFGANLAAPAAAFASPDWQTFTLTSKTYCTLDTQWQVPGIYAQTCIVVNGNYTQAVVKITNTSGLYPPIYVGAHSLQLIENTKVVSEVSCWGGFPLYNGDSMACVGPTYWRPCSSYVQSWAYITIMTPDDRVWYATKYSPTRKMCS